jgi:ribonuclease HI
MEVRPEKKKTWPETAQGVWPPRWIKLPAGKAKINVDATVSKNSRRSASAIVARDEGGNFLGASTRAVEGNTDAEVVEAIACREGLALASDLGLQAAKTGQ